MDCKIFQNELPDLILTPGAMPSPAASAHLRECAPCQQEYRDFQATFAALDTFTAPAPSPWFDQKLAARVRAEQAAPRMGFLESLRTRLAFNTSHAFRPVMAGAFALILAVGGCITSFTALHTTPQQPATSATVQDLQILDHNEQAFQQMDLLQQDDDSPQQAPAVQQDGPTT